MEEADNAESFLIYKIILPLASAVLLSILEMIIIQNGNGFAAFVFVL